MDIKTAIKSAAKRFVDSCHMVTIGELKGDIEIVFGEEHDSVLTDVIVELIKEGKIKRATVKIVCNSFKPEQEIYKILLLSTDCNIVGIGI